MRSAYTGIKLQSEVVDKSTIKFTIESGMGPFPSYLALLNRSAIIHRDSYDAEGKVAKIIGTGPFMMDAVKPGESYTLVKNPNYWKAGEPLLDSVVLKVITDPVVRLNALRTGEVDMAEELPMADVKKLVDTPDPDFTVQVYYINSGERLVMNTPACARSTTRMPAWRLQAVFDREQYNEAIFFGLGQTHNQPFTPDNVWRLDVPTVMPDLTKAKEYFKASGLPEGTPVKFLLMANQKDKGEVIQAMLGQVGLRGGVRRRGLGRVEQQGPGLRLRPAAGHHDGHLRPGPPLRLPDQGQRRQLAGRRLRLGADERAAGRGQRRDQRGQAPGDLQAGGGTGASGRSHDLRAGPALGRGVAQHRKDYQPGTSPALMMMDASDGLNKAWLDK